MVINVSSLNILKISCIALKKTPHKTSPTEPFFPPLTKIYPLDTYKKNVVINSASLWHVLN